MDDRYGRPSWMIIKDDHQGWSSWKIITDDRQSRTENSPEDQNERDRVKENIMKKLGRVSPGDTSGINTMQKK